MSSNQLFEEFKELCQNYEIENGSIILKNTENILKVYKPNNPEFSNYLIYKIISQNGEESGFESDIEGLVELCKNVIGEDAIKTKGRSRFY